MVEKQSPHNAVINHGMKLQTRDKLSNCNSSQGAADARKRPESYSPLCEQADDNADAVPCELLHNAQQGGFTLLEVMVAVMLLGLSYVAVLESFSSSLKRLIKTEQRLEFFLEQDMQMIRTMHYTGISIEEPENQGELFLEGTTYSLYTITGDKGLLQTLELRKN